MAPPRPRPIRDVVGAPLRDRRFRQLMRFLAAWTFAAALTGPFVAVYLLRRLELSVALVVGLGVATQLVNAGALPLWSRVADRFGAKPVLTLAGALFLATFLLWPVAGQLADSRLLLPVLLGTHVLAGIGNAGVTLGTSTIAMRAAPRGESTAYLATNALASGAAAALAPALAGVIAAWSLPRSLTLDVRWTAAIPGGERFAFSALELRGLDFLFLAGWVAGLYAMHRLLAVEEGAPVGREEVASALASEMRRAVLAVPGGAVLTRAVGFPLRRLAYLLPERRDRAGRQRAA
jgi:MFS family permease